MTPEDTLSTTARATAACAGPNICTACVAFLMVTLLKRSVSGFAGRLGVTTAGYPAGRSHGCQAREPGRKMELFRGLGRWCLARGDPPRLVRQPLEPLLRVVELRGRHLLRPAGDLPCVAEEVVQHLPQRPILTTLGAGPRAHALWIPRARSSAVLNSPAAARTVEASPRSARSLSTSRRPS